ncbi:MAG TPA: 2,3-bisphosphoglycerate-independent phosphoglycerate mutase [Gaiellaceae bacterium]|nr:2,3-bisphosphoglycerate-independent phosphoglycerate mutase [Gaiellaceae bacterium]
MPSRRFPLVALIILDGWGIAPAGPGNAVELADTPVFDRLWRDCPHAQLASSGGAVGLPDGQMGNSEVGHLTIGSGRILFQDLVRVNTAIADGSFFENPVLRGAFERGENVHLLGLVSRGGVHSHIDHLKALLEFAPEKTWIHAFTDGRDVSPHSAVHDLAELPANRIATVAGRYYAMDRDNRWDRTQKALEAVTNPVVSTPKGGDAVAEVQRNYDAGVTDEFIEPTVIEGRPRLDPETDTAIFFNFRPDRGRQLSQKLGELGVDLTTMTRYRDDFPFPVAFPEHVVEGTLAEVLSEHGIRQLHAAETEKYAHVTYFLDGGREEPFAAEERILVDSPRDVPSYDHKPEMSATEVADKVVAAIDAGGLGFVVVNFANPDMVGHTGVIPAVVQAVETTDACLGRVVDAVERAGGVCLIIADHGNAEKLLQDDGVSPHTAHTMNPVPAILTAPGFTLRDGELSEVAPTILALLGVPKSSQMTQNCLLEKS